MLPLLVGVIITAGTAAAVAGLVGRAWGLARAGTWGGPLIAASAAGLSSLLLQALGAGEPALVPGVWTIDWTPVRTSLSLGVGIAVIVSLAIALTRFGGRRERAARRERARRRAERARQTKRSRLA